MNGGTNNLLPEIHQIASGTGWFIASYSEQGPVKIYAQIYLQAPAE